jgi:hypothetical protein
MLRFLSVILCLSVVLLGDLLATAMRGLVGDEGAVVRAWLSTARSKYAALSADVQRAPLGDNNTAVRSANEDANRGIKRIGGRLVVLICAGYLFMRRQRGLVSDYPSKR